MGDAVLIVPLEEAEPGMQLAMNVAHPENPEQDLLKRGFMLDTVVLAKLRAMGVEAIYVDYPGLEDLDKHLAPTLSPERQKMYKQVKATIAAVQKTARPTVGFADYYSATRDFIMTLLQSGQHPIFLDQISARMGADAVAHATAVAHLSLVMGIRLQRYLMDQRRRLSAQHASEVVNLGIAGMLHDLGKAKLPEKLHKFDELNRPEEDRERKEWI
jgi:hypothetical protein